MTYEEAIKVLRFVLVPCEYPNSDCRAKMDEEAENNENI